MHHRSVWHARKSSGRPTRHRPLVRTAVVGALAAGLPLTVLPAASAQTVDLTAEVTAAGTGIVFGASGGVDQLANAVGTSLQRHSFGQLDGSVPAGRLINMRPNVPWRSVSAAAPGSAVYTNLSRWADTLKARSEPIMFTFSHEPEGQSSQGLGTATEFINAFRKVREVFTARGVGNVEYTWNMTSNAFRVPASDARHAPKWYPGDAYVDLVASAAYNWYTCGEGRGQWLSLANRAEAPLAFARAHGKKYVIAEWGSQRDSRRAAWLNEARAWLLANKASIRGAFYYQTIAVCSWALNTQAEYDAFGQMARDKVNFGG